MPLGVIFLTDFFLFLHSKASAANIGLFAILVHYEKKSIIKALTRLK